MVQLRQSRQLAQHGAAVVAEARQGCRAPQRVVHHQVLQPEAGGELPEGPEGGDARGGQIEGGEARQEVQQPRAHLGERVRGQVEVAQAWQRWQAGEGGQAVLRQVQDLEGGGALLERGW